MKSLPRARASFVFNTRLHLRQLTGVTAATLEDLCKGIESLPGSVIYHHTHHFLQQHQYLTPEPPNDFADWVRNNFGEEKLAEELLAIPTHEYTSIRDLREKILAVLKSHLKKHAVEHRAMEGQEFFFVRSVSFIFTTPYKAWDIAELADCLRKVTIDSIYFHFFEARLRLGRGTNDFSDWLDKACGEHELAKRLARLDPYSHTLEGLRNTTLKMLEARLKELRKG
jgi:hypothetical protein